MSNFGNYDTLALSGDGTVLTVGAPDQNYQGTTAIAGAVYTYRYASSSWGTPSLLTIAADTTSVGYRDFGRSLDMSSDGLKLLVGDRKGSTPTAEGGGIAYQYARTSLTSSWTNANSFQSAGLANVDAFGSSVALPGAAPSRPVIGAPFRAVGGVSQAGSAYIY